MALREMFQQYLWIYDVHLAIQCLHYHLHTADIATLRSDVDHSFLYHKGFRLVGIVRDQCL